MKGERAIMAQETTKITTWTIVKAIGVIIAIVATFYSIDTYITIKIEKRLNDPMVTRRIAKQVRPFAIFSGTGTILVDNGAMEYLADLTIQNDAARRIPEKVIVVPKRYMAHAPLITAIDQPGTVVRPKRRTGLTWEYTFHTAYVLEPGVAPDKKTTAEDDRYRLEIIQ
jgi:hypothetical protein